MPFDPVMPRSFPSAGIHAMGHEGEGGAPIAERGSPGFVFEFCVPGQIAMRPARLVLEYKPVCNGDRQSGR